MAGFGRSMLGLKIKCADLYKCFTLMAVNVGEWRKLHNEELNDLYFSPSVVRVIKPRE